MITSKEIAQYCETLMSRALHNKRMAEADHHISEENHQDGRWHGINDILEFIEDHEKRR